MLKKTLFILLFTTSLVYGFAQSKIYKTNSIYVEAGGPGILYSINYDIVLSNPINDVGVIAGVGIAPFQNIYDRGALTTVPIRFRGFRHFLKQHTVEFGGSLTPAFYNEEVGVSIAGHLGYKYTFPVGFYIGIAFTPLLNELKFTGDSSFDTFGPFPWGGIQMGHRF